MYLYRLFCILIVVCLGCAAQGTSGIERGGRITTVLVTETPTSTPTPTFTPFIPVVAAPTATPSTVVVASSSGFSPTTIAVIVVPICVGLILVIVAALLWKRRRGGKAKGRRRDAADVEKQPVEKPVHQETTTTRKRHTMPEMVMKLAGGHSRNHSHAKIERQDSRREVKSYYEPRIRRSRGLSAPADRPRTKEHGELKPSQSRRSGSVPARRPRTSDNERPNMWQNSGLESIPNSRPRTRDRSASRPDGKQEPARASSRPRKTNYEPGDYYDPNIRQGRSKSSAPSTRPVTRDQSQASAYTDPELNSATTSRPETREDQTPKVPDLPVQHERGRSRGGESLHTGEEQSAPSSRQSRSPAARRTTANFSRPRGKSTQDMNGAPRAISTERRTARLPPPPNDAEMPDAKLTFF